jgi:alpha-tubulin suppressor-like RCC1 family protein
MKTAKSSGLLACAGLCALLLLSGCGGSSSNTTIPASTTIFYAHSAIFKNNSSVLTMGYNAFGQLGQGNLDTSAVARKVPGIGTVNGVAAGGDHTIAFAFANLSSVYAWGSNYHGQIGITTTTGTSAYSSTPVRIALHGSGGPGLVTGVAAGWYHSLAIVDGTVFSWGYGGYGQLGPRSADFTLADNYLPLQVLIGGSGSPALKDIKQVAAGGGTSYALTTDGRVFSWGDNTYGQLGRTELNGLYDSTPTLVKDANNATLTNVLQIAAAGSNAYAIVNDGTHAEGTGTVWAWGYNGQGQLGKNPADTPAVGTTPAVAATSFSSLAVQVFNADGTPLIAKKVVPGLDHVLALLADGTVMAWGFNEYSQLGNGLIVDSFVPVAVLSDAIAGHLLTGVTDIAAFGNSSLALVNGTWYGWGDNGYGQLGNPISTSSSSKLFIPVLVQRQ